MAAVGLALAGWCDGALVSSAGAEEYLIDTWRLDDELPRDGIMSIGQGQDGYLWVSSRYGLARFDGARFVSFNSQIEAQFLGHHYASITSEPSGGVWLGTPGTGLVLWRDGQLRHCLPAGNPVLGPVLAGLTNAQGRNLVLAPDGRVLGWSNGVPELVVNAGRWGGPVPRAVAQENGNIWFVTYEHNLVRVCGTNAQEMLYGRGEEARNWIALQSGPGGEVWAGTQRGLGIWRGTDFQPVAPPVEGFPIDDLVAAPTGGSSDAKQSSQSRFWVVALGRAWLLEKGLWTTNVAFEQFVGRYETSPRVADRHGNLWFSGTRGGLARAGGDGSLTVLTEKDGLPPGRLGALHEDREGSLWVGIQHAGLARVRERYFTALAMRGGLQAPLVWAVAQDRAGNIWLGTEHNGLQRWKDGQSTRVELEAGGLESSVYSLCVDRRGTVWAGTEEGSVFRYENGKFLMVWRLAEPGWNQRIYVIYEDRRGQMWFGTGMGLFRWQAGEAHRCNARGFDAGIVRVLAEDASGRLWAGLSGGAPVRLASIEGDELVPRGNRQGLAGYEVFGLCGAADGSLWVGTVGGGLWHWRENECSQLSLAEGLPEERIYQMQEDAAGNLWLCSPSGIIRLAKADLAAFEAGHTARLEYLLFDRTDGLPTRECSGGSQPSVFRASDGRLLFAMSEGAVALSPEQVQVNTVRPPVHIEEVRVDGKLLQARLRQGPRWRLGPGRHMVEFRYTALSLRAPAKVRFRGRLSGIDRDWRAFGSARTATYSLSSPGDYDFQVVACNNDGIWNEAGADLALEVEAYVWQKGWFRVAALLLIAGLTAASLRALELRKHQRKLAALELEQRLEQERSRIARDIHDELGSRLTEIGLLSELARRVEPLAEQVKADIETIAGKARSSTQALDEIVWAVNPRNDTLEGFVTYACAYAEEHLHLARIRCRLETTSPIPPRPLRADVRYHLFLAFKEALNNVVKHARATQVELRVTVTAEQMTMAIRDDGCGFDFDPERPPGFGGNGLANMRERLRSAGGAFLCESARGRGTQVTFSIKVGSLPPV